MNGDPWSRFFDKAFPDDCLYSRIEHFLRERVFSDEFDAGEFAIYNSIVLETGRIQETTDRIWEEINQ